MFTKVCQTSPRLVWFLVTQIPAGEFLRCQIRKLVDFQFVTEVFGVLGINLVDICFEDAKRFAFVTVVNLTVGLLEFSPQCFVVWALGHNVLRQRSAHHWVRGIVQNATHVSFATQSNVTFFAPRGPPRVFDFPIVGAVSSTIPYDQDSMVEAGSTIAGEDTRTISLKLGRINGDGNGAILQSGHQC